MIPCRIKGLNYWERRIGSDKHYPGFIDGLNSTVTAGIAQGILDELQACELTAQHIVDKLPHNFPNIGFIKFLFPNEKIISGGRLNA